jgi:SAM-dependent methyltransferase
VDDLPLLIDLHKDAARQGPGGDDQTRLAVTLSGLKGRTQLHIVDMGCGTGASTLVLADELDAQITAVDLFPDFLGKLEAAAHDAGIADRITTLCASMDALPFADEECDAIWSEGAIYNIGFEAGIKAWRRFLKPGGILAVSELTWLTDSRPEELQAHWDSEYAEVDTASAKLAILERLGFTPVGYFVLPDRCWLNNYYKPMQQRFARFLKKHAPSDAASGIVAAEEVEIMLYERYRAFFGYGFYIARKNCG